MAAKFVLALNRQGKLRFARWYTTYNVSEKRRISRNVLRCIQDAIKAGDTSNCIKYGANEKLIFRKYNGLYFVVCISVSGEEDELRYFMSIPLIVKLLDVYFDNVSELDLIFNFYKIHRVVDQVYVGGELVANRQEEIMDALKLVL